MSILAMGSTWNTGRIDTATSQTNAHTNGTLVGEIRLTIRLARIIVTRDRRMVFPQFIECEPPISFV